MSLLVTINCKVLDVFAPELVPPGHRLWATRNLVMAPHVLADDPQFYNPNSPDIFSSARCRH